MVQKKAGEVIVLLVESGDVVVSIPVFGLPLAVLVDVVLVALKTGLWQCCLRSYERLGGNEVLYLLNFVARFLHSAWNCYLLLYL